MSDHEYTPKSKAGKWFNDRLPLLTLGAHLNRLPYTKKFKLLVDFWGNTYFLFVNSNNNRNSFSDALCGSCRLSFCKC